jgi:hypothetical protein
MSMEELSRLANNTGEDVTLRRKALRTLNEREASNLKRLKPRRWTWGGCQLPNNYVPDIYPT